MFETKMMGWFKECVEAVGVMMLLLDGYGYECIIYIFKTIQDHAYILIYIRIKLIKEKKKFKNAVCLKIVVHLPF